MLGIRQTLAATAGVLLLAGTAYAAEPFAITSSTFKDGAYLPKKAAGANKANPNCVGENVSPQFSWKNVPAGTTSFALVMTDPDGRGIGVDHWIAYGIPRLGDRLCRRRNRQAVRQIYRRHRHREAEHLSRPPGTTPHHYTFILIATDLDPKVLPAGLTKLQLFDKLDGHVKGSTGMIGLFKNPL